MTLHDYLYEVERINKTNSGAVELDLMHFPVDSQQRSLVALAVAGATAGGVVFPTGRNDFSCNVNTSTDPVADEGGNLPDYPSQPDYSIPVVSEGSPGAGENNPDDPVEDEPPQPIPGLPTDRPPLPGDTFGGPGDCEGGIQCAYYGPKEMYDFDTGSFDPSKVQRTECTSIFAGPGWGVIQSADTGRTIVVETRCPDPSSPDGYGPSRFSLPVEIPVLPYYPAGSYRLLRFEGPFPRNIYVNGPFSLYKSTKERLPNYPACTNLGRVWIKTNSDDYPYPGIFACSVSMSSVDFLARVFLINPDGSETELDTAYA